MGKKDTYDIEIDGTHNFVGNDIVAHNTYLNGTLDVSDNVEVTGNLTASGTLSVDSTVTLGGTDNGGLLFTNAGVLTQDATNLFWDDANNNLGVGTNNPELYSGGGWDSQLAVVNNGTSTSDAGIVLVSGASSDLTAIRFADATSPYDQGSIVYDHITDHLAFATNRATRLTIDSAGDVGIGDITTPDAHLEISANGSSGGAVLYVSSDDDNDGDLFTILESGNIGINTTSPTRTLTINGSANITGALDASGDLRIGADGNDLFVNSNTGQVGIGTTTPNQTLHVYTGASGQSTPQAGTVAIIENSSTNYLSFLNPNNVFAGIVFADPEDADVGYVLYDHASDAVTMRAGAGPVTTLSGSSFSLHGGDHVFDSTGSVTLNFNNESGGDFRVESVNQTYMLFLDASTDQIGIGGDTSPDATLEIVDLGTADIFQVSSAAGNDGDYLTVDTNGTVALGGSLDVSGAAYIDDNLTVSGSIDVTGALSISATTTLSGALTVDGVTTLNNDVTFGAATPTITTVAGETFTLTDGTDTLTVNFNDSSLAFSDGSNSFTFDVDSGATYAGNARPTRQVTLSPEYPNASLTGDGGSNTGTMTSDFCEQGAHADIPDTNTSVCNTSGDIHNYYNWTTGEASAQDFDIWIRWRVPDNFSAWASNPIDVFAKRTDATNNAVTVYVYDTAGALENSGGTQVAGTTWTSTTVESSFAGTYTAGSYMTIRIVMTADTGGDSVQAGEINLDYLATN